MNENFLSKKEDAEDGEFSDQFEDEDVNGSKKEDAEDGDIGNNRGNLGKGPHPGRKNDGERGSGADLPPGFTSFQISENLSLTLFNHPGIQLVSSQLTCNNFIKWS